MRVDIIASVVAVGTILLFVVLNAIQTRQDATFPSKLVRNVNEAVREAMALSARCDNGRTPMVSLGDAIAAKSHLDALAVLAADEHLSEMTGVNIPEIRDYTKRQIAREIAKFA